MNRIETIKINLSKDFKNALIFEVKRTYGDIELEKAILNILQEWVKEIETQPIVEEEYFEEPIADVCALLEKEKEFFEIATPALEADILDPNYQLDFLHWNGNVLENIVKVRAQVMHILEPKDYPALGKKIFENILNAVEHSKEVNL